MFAIIEFETGGELSIINSSWLTPKKKEVFWPPEKNLAKFNKQLRREEQNINEDTWELFGVKRIFYETDDFEKAKDKIKIAEYTSDIQTDLEQLEEVRPKRFSLNRRRLISDSENDSSDSEIKKSGGFASLPNTPAIKLKLKSVKDAIHPSPRAFETSASNTSVTSMPKKPVATATTEDSFNSSNDLIGVQVSSTPRTASAFLRNEEPVSSNAVMNVTAQTKFWSLLLEIKAQNAEILALIRDKGFTENSENKENNPLNFPFQLPLKSNEDLEDIEKYLDMPENSKVLINFLSKCGGKDTTTRTNRIMKFVLADSVAVNYNFFGKRSNKKPFCDLKLRIAVVGAVQVQGLSPEKDIEDAVKKWLKHAPERLKKMQQRL